MVTLGDPTLKRLVEVNPAPEDLELPPISDAALCESILERARSEEVWLRPAPARLWRPGLVVAAAAFVAVLVVAGAIGLLSGIFSVQEGPVMTEPPVVTTIAPVPTTTPPAVTTTAPVPTTTPPTVTTVAPVPSTIPRYEVTISESDDGSFSASGSAVDAGVVCSEGTIDTITITRDLMRDRFGAGGEYSDVYDAVEERTLTCADGSGAMVFGTHVNQSQRTAGYFFTGEWVVVSGSGGYKRVAGGGEIDGSCDPERSNCSHEYTGRLDRQRDLGTAPAAAAPVGRHDVEITSDSGWGGGLFTATGAAVDAGLVCQDGTFFGTAPYDGNGWWESTFFCSDGTGWMTLGGDMRRSSTGNSWPPVAIRYRGSWAAMGGSGEYAEVTGDGRLLVEEVDQDEGRLIWAWTGYVETSE